MKIITISEQQFDNFAKNHVYKNYCQTSSYGNTMKKSGFDIEYIGIVDDVNVMIGASLIIYKTVFMGKSIAYAPRGILFNYDIQQYVDELVICLKTYLRKKNCLSFKMDPYIVATIRNSKGKSTSMNNSINTIMANLKHAGFTYKGQNKFFENEVSRYEATLLLNNRTIKDIYVGFSKSVRHKVNKAANSGITIVNDSDKKLDTLYAFCKNNHINKLKNFHKNLIESFGNKASLYYAVLDTNVFVTVSKNIYEKEMDRNDELAQKIQSFSVNSQANQKLLNSKIESDRLLDIYKNQLVVATKLLEEHPKNIILGAAITIEFDNAIYLVDDFYMHRFSTLCANYLIRWFIINEAKNKNYKFLNLNYMVGEFVKKTPYFNLNDNKLGFGCIPTEYIGEFELVIDNLNNKLFQSFSKDKNYMFKNGIK